MPRRPARLLLALAMSMSAPRLALPLAVFALWRMTQA
jgi:hypothetical protein